MTANTAFGKCTEWVKSRLQPSRTLGALGLILALLLTACGGSTKVSDPGLTLGPTSLSFTSAQGAISPAPKAIRIDISSPDAAYVGAAWVGSAAPDWAVISDLSGSGRIWHVQVQITNTSLAPGTYTATLRVGIAKSDGNTIIATRDAQITYQVKTELAATPGALNFSHVVGSSAPSSQSINITGTGLAWQASADKPWIKLGNSAGTAPSTVAIQADPTGLTAGSYAGVITIIPQSGTGTVHVQVNLTVTDPVLQTDTATLSFTGVNGEPIASKALNLAMSNGMAVNWTATASAGWIVLSKSSGITSDVLSISVDPSQGALASGAYNGTITFFGNQAGVAVSTTVPVAMALTKPNLSFDTSTLVLGGQTGMDLSARHLTFSLNTGGLAHAWQVTPSQSWMSVDASSGSVSGSPAVVTVGIHPDGLSGGTYSGELNFSAVVNGDTVTAAVPVTLNLETHRLLASDSGVALASMPTLAKTTRTLQVRDNFGEATPWTATADQPWLSATPSGTAGGDLVITANPIGLAPDPLHYASVSIFSEDPAIATDVVKIGFWVGSADPNPSKTINQAFTNLVVDPIRPYAYVHDGGTDITVYHVFTGALVRKFSSVAPQLGSMVVSLNGDRLYVVDKTNFKICPVALSDGLVGSPYSLGTPYIADLTYSRVSGLGVIFTTAGKAINANSGALLTANSFFYGTAIATSLDGSHLCTSYTDASPSDVLSYAIAYTSLDGGKIVAGEPRIGFASGYEGDVAMNANGTRAYVVAGGLDVIYVFDTVPTAGGAMGMPLVKSLPADIHTINVEIARDERIFASAATWYGDKDAWVFRPDGMNLASYRIAGSGRQILEGMLKVTGDGLCMVSLTDDPKLVFTSIVP